MKRSVRAITIFASMLGAATALAQPANDLCSTATSVGLGAPAATGNNALATTDTNVTCATSNKDVWFAFTSLLSESLIFDTEGSTQPDTVLAVFSACGGVVLACDDDSGSGNLSRLQLSVTAGTTVFVRLASFGTAPAGGVFRLNIGQLGACCAPAGTCTISSLTSCLAPSAFVGVNTVCSPNPCSPTTGACCTTLAACSLTTATVCSSAGSIFLGVGTVCSPNPCVPASGACCALGGGCTVVLATACASPSTFNVGGLCIPNICPQPPANDLCDFAIPVLLGTPAATGNNAAAPTETTVSCTASNKDVWYSFVAPATAVYAFDTEGSTQPDTVLSLHGTCIGLESECDDDSGTGLLSRLQATLAVGQKIQVRVASFGGTPAGGPFSLNITLLTTGACCIPGVCLSDTQASCSVQGGVYMGDGSVCTPDPCLPPIITGVTPLTGTQGDLITINGDNFGNNPDNICALICGVVQPGNQNQLTPLDIVTINNTTITARLGAVPFNIGPGPVMVRRGIGFRRPFIPFIKPLWVEDFRRNWGWCGIPELPAGVGNQDFQAVFTPRPPGTIQSSANVDHINNTVCLFVDGNWMENTKVQIWNRLHGTQNGNSFVFWDANICFRVRCPGDAHECALVIADSIRCLFAQNFPPVIIDIAVFPAGFNRWKIQVTIPNGTITKGALTMQVTMPNKLFLPSIASITAFGEATLAPFAPTGVTVGGIGGTGQDGATVTLPAGATNGVDAFIVPIDLDFPGRWFFIENWGHWNNRSWWCLGGAWLCGQQISCLNLCGDFRPIGSEDVIVRVRDVNGIVTGQIILPAGPLGVIQGIGPQVPLVDCFGKLPPDPPCVYITFTGDFRYTPDGSNVPIIGRTVEVLAANATAPIQAVNQIVTTMRNPAGLPPMQLTYLDARPRGGLTGACCCGSHCEIMNSATCNGPGMSFAGSGTTCTPFSNTVPCCRGDFNKSSTVSVQDIFDFLSGYFSGSPCADTNDTGGANTVQDIFDFLAAYFGGC